MLLQSLGIIAGLLFTAFSIRQSTKARRVGDLLTLAEHYRELWSQVQHDPKLERVSRQDLDLVREPITRVEEEFLDLVIIHFNTSYLIAKDGALLTLDALAKDAQYFFKLPIPSKVWQQTKPHRDVLFVRFVDEALSGSD